LEIIFSSQPMPCLVSVWIEVIRQSHIDTALAKDQLQGLQYALKTWGVPAFMASMFWILTKFKVQGTNMEASRLVPFQLHRIQMSVEKDLARNNIFGKPRQSGFTTYLSVRRLLLPAITDGGVGSLLVSQSGEYVQEHFMIAQRAYRFIGAVDPFNDELNTFSKSLKANLLHTAYSNRRELVFDYLDSKVRVASAEVEEAGQGLTLQHIVADEYARWPGNPEATLANIRGALVPGGTVDKSSTANGAGGPFFEDVQRALNDAKESDAKLFFYPWWWESTYDDTVSPAEQMEMEQDLTADELRVIAQMHRELSVVVHV
jgi:hypothetical protein